MTNDRADGRPPIHMIDSEAEALSDLALGVESRLPEVSAMLIEEISRATLHHRDRIGSEIVTMNAAVEFIDEATGASRTVRIVFPRVADIATGRISILTPVGAGLIGLSKGQSIDWPDRDGHLRRLTIVAVSQPAA